MYMSLSHDDNGMYCRHRARLIDQSMMGLRSTLATTIMNVQGGTSTT